MSTRAEAPKGAALAAQRELAESAGLHYVSDEEPGITRRQRGRSGFTFLRPDGRALRDRAARSRILALAIPPAWTDVWIATDPRGHIQATGRDERGRKQYRYHPLWEEVRDVVKFGRLRAFGRALPRIRRGVSRALRSRTLSRARVLAAVIALLEATAIRVGNDEYARENDTFGLTTLRRRHVQVDGDRILFRLTTKGGKRAELALRDRTLARVVLECRDAPGHELFKWVDAARQRHDVKSGDVNEFLRELAGEDFTAKDFRTWLGTVHAFAHLCGLDEPASARAAEKQCVEAIDSVAERLRNTRAVARGSYIHPAVLASHLERPLGRRFRMGPAGRTRGTGLSSVEKRLLALLDEVVPRPSVGKVRALRAAAGGAATRRAGRARSRSRACAPWPA